MRRSVPGRPHQFPRYRFTEDDDVFSRQVIGDSAIEEDITFGTELLVTFPNNKRYRYARQSINRYSGVTEISFMTAQFLPDFD